MIENIWKLNSVYTIKSIIVLVLPLKRYESQKAHGSHLYFEYLYVFMEAIILMIDKKIESILKIKFLETEYQGIYR
jgi:presenilin-like A22 family membrane protease